MVDSSFQVFWQESALFTLTKPFARKADYLLNTLIVVSRHVAPHNIPPYLLILIILFCSIGSRDVVSNYQSYGYKYYPSAQYKQVNRLIKIDFKGLPEKINDEYHYYYLANMGLQLI